MKPSVLLAVLVATSVTLSPDAGQRRVEVFVHDVSIFDPYSGTLLPHRYIVVEDTLYPYPFSKLTAQEKNTLFDAFRSSKAAVVPTFIAWKPATQPGGRALSISSLAPNLIARCPRFQLSSSIKPNSTIQLQLIFKG